MIGDFSSKVRDESAKNVSKKSPFACAIFSLDSAPLPANRNLLSLSLQSDLFQTNLIYSVQYKNYSSTIYNRNDCKPFIVKADFLPQARETSSKFGYIRVNSYDELCEIAKTNKHIQWLVNWTTLIPKMFEVVQGCPGLLLYFTLDVEKYEAHLREQGCNEPLSTMFIIPETTELADAERETKIELNEEYRLERDRIRKRQEYYRKKQRGEK